jgi:CheY-like chemotaxis protein
MKNPSILIVEDDGVIALSLLEVLQKSGYEVPDPVASGEEALHYLTHFPAPDLILMDIKLYGGSDGIEIAGQIRKTSDIPIIFISAHYDDFRMARAGEIARSGFIVKPFTDQEILSVIEEMLHR